MTPNDILYMKSRAAGMEFSSTSGPRWRYYKYLKRRKRKYVISFFSPKLRGKLHGDDGCENPLDKEAEKFLLGVVVVVVFPVLGKELYRVNAYFGRFLFKRLAHLEPCQTSVFFSFFSIRLP